MATPRVDVLIVNHDTRDRLRECLAAVEAQDDVRRIRVADNGSGDGSFDMVRREFPAVDAASLPHNPGFGAGINHLAARSDAPVLVVLNADARPEPGAVAALADHLDAHPDAAIVGPRLVGTDGELQRSCFSDPDVRELLWQESGLHAHRRGDLPTFDHRADRDVPWVLGAAFAVRRSAFDEVGGFDEGFFLYYEEVDLCRRLRSAGWRVLFTPSAQVVHIGGASTSGRSVLAQREHYRSLRRYHDLHGSARASTLRAAVTSIMLARLVRDGAVGLLPGDRGAIARADRIAWRAVLSDALEGWPTARPPVERRTDWLALLPNPPTDAPALAIVGTVDEAERSVVASRVGARTVTDRLDAGPFDVIVAIDPDDDLASIAGALGPRGSAIVVATGRIRSGAVRLRRLAERHGARVLSQHWVLPDARAPRRFVPLDHAGALRWYLHRLLIPSGVVQRTVRRGLVRVPAAARLVAREHATIMTFDPAADPAYAPMVRSEGRTDPGEPVGDVRAIVLTSGHDLGSRTIVLPFAPGTDAPVSILKIAGSSALNEATRREHDALADLAVDLPSPLRHTVPRPLSIGRWRGLTVTNQSSLDGPTLDVVLRTDRRRHPADASARVEVLDAVVDWLSDLHRHTATPLTIDDESIDDWFCRPFDRHLRLVDDTPDVRALFDAAASTARTATSLPLVRRHVDLAPWNIVASADGTIGVLDWESAGGRPHDGRGLAFCDLDYFVKFWLHIEAGADDEADQTSLFALVAADDPGAAGVDAATAAAIDAAIDRYCVALELDRDHLWALSVHGWVEQCLYGVDRRTMLATATSPIGDLAGRVVSPGGPASGFVDEAARRRVRSLAVRSPRHR